MRVLLVCGFGDTLGDDLKVIAGLQFAGVRRDVTVEHIDEYAAEIAVYPNLYVLCILRSSLDCSQGQLVSEAVTVARSLQKAGLTKRSAIEIGNEPNLLSGWAKDPKQFQTAVNACAAAIWAAVPDLDVVSGGVSNTGTQQQAYLRSLVTGLHEKVIVGYHTYRTESSPDTPLSGFATRAAEQAALNAILGTRRRMNTETGWHTSEWAVRGMFGQVVRRGRFTEAQVAAYVKRECEIAKQAGCESVSLYQLNDGPEDDGLGRFGIRHLDGTLKPVSAVPAAFVEVPANVPLVSFRVLDEAGAGLVGVRVTFRLDDPAYPQVTLVTGAAGKVTYPATVPGVGLNVRLDLAGYESKDERRLIPTVTSAGPLPEWPATTVMLTAYPRVSFRVVDEQGRGLEKATVRFRKDDPALPVVSTLTDANGRVVIRAKSFGIGVTVIVEKDGFLTREERRLIPSVSTDNAPEWAPTLTLVSKTKWQPTRAQIINIQCDLMLWCPEVRPQPNAQGIDEALQIHLNGDIGRAHGIEAGWVWTTTIGNYPPASRQIIYEKAKSYGWTHFPLHVPEMGPGTGYHGVFPMTQAMSDAYGETMNTVHRELLAHRLIPVCAGVAAGRPPARNLDASQVLVAFDNWDDTAEKAENISVLAAAFPKAVLFCELPAGHIFPEPAVGFDPVSPTEGSSNPWIRGMRQRFPNFVGVIHEANISASVDDVVSAYTAKHGWWHDLVENQGEVDTFDKFWHNWSYEDTRQRNDEIARRCPWLNGSMSGWTMRPAPTGGGDVTAGGSSSGDAIDPAQIVAVGGKPFLSWPATAKITKLVLSNSGVYVEFSKKDGPTRWPDVTPPGWDGPVQYSLGVVVRRNGQWYAVAPVECWHKDVFYEFGGPIQSQAVEGTSIGQLAKNWWYAPVPPIYQWDALVGYQPQPGDELGFLVVAGSVRNNTYAVQERSSIVTFRLPPSGKEQTFTWM